MTVSARLTVLDDLGSADAVQTPDVAGQSPDVAGQSPDVEDPPDTCDLHSLPCSPVRRELCHSSRIRDLRSRSGTSHRLEALCEKQI